MFRVRLSPFVPVRYRPNLPTLDDKDENRPLHPAVLWRQEGNKALYTFTCSSFTATKRKETVIHCYIQLLYGDTKEMNRCIPLHPLASRRHGGNKPLYTAASV